MDRMPLIIINGIEYYLNYSIEIMFEVEAKFGDVNHLLEVLQTDGRESFEALRWALVAMANDGELARRDAGYEANAMLTEAEFTLRMQPLEYSRIKMLVVQTIAAAYNRSAGADNEVDLGLIEIEKKTGRPKIESSKSTTLA